MQNMVGIVLVYTSTVNRCKLKPMTPSHLPAYAQVKAFIQAHISAGTWKPGDPVPSESVLMKKFGVSRMTANRALRELTDEGLVNRIKGLGSFVAELHRISSTIRIRDIQEEVTERGHVHTCRVVHSGIDKATPELAQMLGLRSGARVFHTVLVHLENGVPIQWEDRYVNPAAAPNYLKTDWTTTTPTHYLLTHAPLTQASYTIEACVPSPEQAKALDISATEACLAMVRRTVSGANVASLARLVYPGSRYRFTGEFQS
jgi:GntR family histidine utilization transcriptional repressor